MAMSGPIHSVAAILPCTNMEASTAFYARLGLKSLTNHASYRILTDGRGWMVHLSTESPAGWVVPERNPNGLYLYTSDVDALAERMRDAIIGQGPGDKPWGMYEFALSDPDGTLVRVGCPSEMRG